MTFLKGADDKPSWAQHDVLQRSEVRFILSILFNWMHKYDVFMSISWKHCYGNCVWWLENCVFVWAEVKLLIVFRRRRAVAAGCNAALNWRTPFSGLIVRVQQRRFSCFALKGRSCTETGRFVLSASDRFSASADFHFSTKKKKKSIIQLCLATSGYAPPPQC